MWTHGTRLPFLPCQTVLLTMLAAILLQEVPADFEYFLCHDAVLQDSYSEVALNIVDLMLNWQLFSDAGSPQLKLSKHGDYKHVPERHCHRQLLVKNHALYPCGGVYSRDIIQYQSKQAFPFLAQSIVYTRRHISVSLQCTVCSQVHVHTGFRHSVQHGRSNSSEGCSVWCHPLPGRDCCH